MKLIVLLIFSILWNCECLAMPVEQGSVTDIVEATPYPDLQKRYVDINNVSPEVSIILQDNNLNLDSIRRMQQELQNKTRYVTPTPTFPPATAPKEFEEVIRLNSIKTSLEKTLRKPEDGDGQSNAEFDYSLSAVCEVPKHINLSEWFEQKTWNILFKPNYKQYNVKSVFLRLFKVATQNSKTSNECDTDVGEFYKMTISIYSRKRKEIKKRIIFAKMIASNFNGWIEIDALSTVKSWDNLKNNYGLAIDIYDQDENQLNAKEHFHLQNCEAGPSIPWRGLELLAKSTGSPVTEDVLEIYRNVYTGPRLDLVSSTPANYFVSSAEVQQERTRHSRHTHGNRHHHLQRSSEESFEHNSHQTSTGRRDRSHRGSSNVEET